MKPSSSCLMEIQRLAVPAASEARSSPAVALIAGLRYVRGRQRRGICPGRHAHQSRRKRLAAVLRGRALYARAALVGEALGQAAWLGQVVWEVGGTRVVEPVRGWSVAVEGDAVGDVGPSPLVPDVSHSLGADAVLPPDKGALEGLGASDVDFLSVDSSDDVRSQGLPASWRGVDR
eukprot:765386-Hanusia_phi.AAC.14